VYLVVRLGVCVIQAFSDRAAHVFISFLGWLAYHLDRKHRLVALDNLRQAFPRQYDKAELDELVREVYRHFGRLLVEIIRSSRKLHAHNCEAWFDLGRDRQTIRELLGSDRPVLIVSGHFGNWEMAGYCLGLLGFQTHAMARPLDNPFLDRFLRRFRERAGQQILAKNGGLDRIRDVLARGGKVATLVDQDAGSDGLFVTFFGRPTSTVKSVALMALRYGAALLVVGIPNVGGLMRYRVTVEDVILPEEYGGSRSGAVRAITQRYTTALERIIRRHPEQYFWLHRRWKHQPQERMKNLAA
jgi:KDO2-lipid IV(A) lauroyltransferase